MGENFLRSLSVEGTIINHWDEYQSFVNNTHEAVDSLLTTKTIINVISNESEMQCQNEILDFEISDPINTNTPLISTIHADAQEESISTCISTLVQKKSNTDVSFNRDSAIGSLVNNLDDKQNALLSEQINKNQAKKEVLNDITNALSSKDTHDSIKAFIPYPTIDLTKKKSNRKKGKMLPLVSGKEWIEREKQRLNEKQKKETNKGIRKKIKLEQQEKRKVLAKETARIKKEKLLEKEEKRLNKEREKLRKQQEKLQNIETRRKSVENDLLEEKKEIDIENQINELLEKQKDLRQRIRK